MTTPVEKELSCYTTHLMLKFAGKNKLRHTMDGISVPIETLNDPHAWTDVSVWSKMAQNIEQELGGGQEVLVNIVRELIAQETTSFIPFLLKVAPMKILQSSVTTFCRKYSNKNIHVSFRTLGKGRWLYTIKRLVPGPFTTQMCDYHKAQALAFLDMRGYQNIKVTELSCAARDGAPACEYLVEGASPPSRVRLIRQVFSNMFRNSTALLQLMEENHRSLQKQYHEILGIKDFYSHIMENMGESVIWLNTAGSIEFINNAFCKFIGMSESEILNQRFEGFFTTDDDAEHYAQLYTACRLQPLIPFEALITYHSQNGENRNGQTTIIWVPGEHRSPGYLITIRDMTEKHKIELQLSVAENRYRSLYENSPAIIVALNMAGRFLYANPAMTEQSGYTEAELKQMHFRELLAPNADFDVEHLIHNLLDHPIRLQEVHFKTKYGEWKCIALNTYHIYAPDGTMAGIAGIGVDVTETKRLNEQIIKSQRMDLLGQLAGGLAHDFGNILTSINGFSKLIAMKSTSEQITDFAASIERAGLRAHDLIKNLLAFSRGDSRQSVIFNVTDIIEEVKEMMFGAAPKSIIFTAQYPDEGLMILGDPGKIHQCLLNLCVNARDAIADRAGTVSIRAQRNDGEKQTVIIEVEDTGGGIPPDIIDRIFDPFFSTKEKKEGTGLGLSVVYGIIKSHRGEITVQSRPGEGTTFTIELPAAVR